MRSARAIGAGALISVFLLTCFFAASPAAAQTPSFESLFDDAARFLQQQGKAIQRELNQMSDEPRGDVPRHTPPLPVANPRRDAGVPTKTRSRPQTLTAQDRALEPATAPREIVAAPQRRPRAGGTSEAPPAPAMRPRLDRVAQVPLPARNPLHLESANQEKPEAPAHPSKIITEDWTREDIDAARSACTEAMAKLVATYEYIEPIREGICGTPSPIRLSSVGAAPKVEIRPPATVTCQMAAELARWLDEVVQPAAREELGESVVAIRNVASYSCRNRYNAPGKRISEHANANALDIASFKTASGKIVALLTHWDATEPPSEDGHEADEDKVSGKASQLTTDNAVASGEGKNPPPEARPEITRVSDSDGPDTATAAKDAEDEAAEADAAPLPVPTAEARFLHTAFEGACKMFGTTLGPEANAAHRDHFHLDMKQRKYGGYCE